MGELLSWPQPATSLLPLNGLNPLTDGFTKVDFDRLGFPAEYKIDYVRVYQDPEAVNLGCSPPDYPTAQWIAW